MNNHKINVNGEEIASEHLDIIWTGSKPEFTFVEGVTIKIQVPLCTFDKNEFYKGSVDYFNLMLTTDESIITYMDCTVKSKEHNKEDKLLDLALSSNGPKITFSRKLQSIESVTYPK